MPESERLAKKALTEPNAVLLGGRKSMSLCEVVFIPDSRRCLVFTPGERSFWSLGAVSFEEGETEEERESGVREKGGAVAALDCWRSGRGDGDCFPSPSWKKAIERERKIEEEETERDSVRRRDENNTC